MPWWDVVSKEILSGAVLVEIVAAANAEAAVNRAKRPGFMIVTITRRSRAPRG
jgi:hypothetical protein